MTRLLRFDMPATGEGRRWVIGVRAGSQCREVRAALVAAAGHGLEMTPAVVGAMTAEVPRSARTLFAADGPGGECPAAALAGLRAQLAEIQASLVQELLAELGVAPSRVLALGVDDPGLWHFQGSVPVGYAGLCDAARLAEWTGLSVIDAFPARDLAQGGQGGPLAALPEWLLLRDAQKSRVLVKLGRTIRTSYLPASTEDRPAARVLSFDAGPGTSLLDRLAERLTAGEHHFDPGGRLAVQGRRLPELLEHWLADPYFDRPPPRWHPLGVRPERFLTESLELAVREDWSVRDLLCTATHFLAQTVAAALTRRLPEDARIDEVIVSGGGQRNGLLLHEMGRAVELPLVKAEQLDAPDEALGAAAVAVLALLAIDRVPANPTSITGADIPRVLGRFTPGSPQQWQRLLGVIAGTEPAARPLRSAV